MNWNWEPNRWKTSTKLFLGIATIWPIVYMVLFLGFIFSMFLFLPFAERGSKPNCGNIDLLQLDRKIKNGEIKQLTIRSREIVGLDRIRDCEFELTVTNESTKQEILNEAREIVNGQPRVEKIEEDTARSEEMPILVPVGFAALMGFHMLTILLMFGLMPLYIILAVKNDRLDQTMRIIWVVLLCTIGMIVNPVYWYLYVWRKSTAPTNESNAPASGGDIPATS